MLGARRLIMEGSARNLYGVAQIGLAHSIMRIDSFAHLLDTAFVPLSMCNKQMHVERTNVQAWHLSFVHTQKLY